MSEGVLNIQNTYWLCQIHALLSMLYMNYFIGKAKHILKKVCSIRVLILLRVSLQINVYIISNKAAPLIVASLLLTRLKKKRTICAIWRWREHWILSCALWIWGAVRVRNALGWMTVRRGLLESQRTHQAAPVATARPVAGAVAPSPAAEAGDTAQAFRTDRAELAHLWWGARVWR